ncbi:MAG TPA: translocation/assembly module TamB domain-containing protein [Candidatus Sulfotelmatobacter sp.]|nr:translocation/assembly module TamB domain-containing protein [Candidatus Sulfotelmatobacter sp.]
MSAKRKIGWTLAGIGIFLLLLISAGYFYLRSSSFQSFALHKIVEEADQATGGKAEIGGLDFKLSTLTAHLYNITLQGTESPTQPPLLHADKLTIGLKIISVLRHKVELEELLIDHPVVHMQVSQQGKNNLPTAPPSQSSSHRSVFDLAVRHAQLTNGELDYNDRKTPLEADLYNLQTDIHFASLAKRYDGNLSYDNGHLKYARYAPLPHNLNLNFRATPDRFELSSMTLKVGSSEVLLHAQVSNYSSPTADGAYQIRIHTQDFASMSPSLQPAGDVSLDGKLHYQAAETQPLLHNVSLDGRLASEILIAVGSGRRIEVRKLGGRYRLNDGNLQLTDLGLDSMGGRIVAEAQMKHIDATPEASVHAALDNISLKALQNASGMQPNQTAALAGTLRGKADAAWTGTINNLRARSDLFVQAVASSRSNPSAREVPVNGALHVAYDGPRQTIEVRDTAFHLPAATVTAQGSISNHSNLQVNVVADDLHQLAALASSFRTTQTAPPAVSGSATLNASVQGSMKKPAITAQLNAQNLQVEGSRWNTAKVTMHAAPSGVTIDNVSLVNAQRGQVLLSASVGLRNWSYEPSNPIRAHLDARQLRLSDLEQLAKKEYPISGDLSANLNLSGSQLEPVGSGSMQIANARAYGEPVQTLAAKFQAQNGTLVSTLNVAAPAGAINANLSYSPKTKAYKVQLNAPAIVLQKLRTVQEKNLNVNGTLNASIDGAGTLDDPQLSATVQLPQLQMREAVISGLKADLRVAQHRANLNVDTNVSQASIHARGTVALTGDYQTDASIDTNRVPLAPLMATYAPSVPQGFQGQTELHATLKGPLKDKSRLEAHLSIPVLEAKYQALEIGITQPIRVDYARSVVTLQPVELKGTGTSLRAQGRIPLGKGGTPTLTAQGSVDLRIVQIVAPTVASAGIVALDVRSSGSAVQGQLKFENVAMTTPDAPIGVEKLNGTMNIGNDRISVTQMTAQVGGGQVSLGGSVAYKPSIEFNLAVQGQSVRLRYPEGLRTVLNTNLAFTGSTQSSVLSGRVIVDTLSFTPDFDLSKFADQFSTANTPTQPGFADTVKLAVNVQTASSLNAVSSQVSIAGQAVLQVGGTAADPVITGRTTLTSGELFYRNLRYELQRGVITFDDPNQTHPVLNVSVNTIVEQYNLTLTLRGPLDKLTTEYVSDPPLATADIINLVARGKTTEEQAASSQSTDSMIASQVAGQLSSSVQKLAGLSSLQIDPTLGGNNQNPSARIALQQRVTKNLLFSFSTDVSQPGSEIVQGEYQINRRWSVNVARDQLGGVSVDGRYHTKF